MHSNIFQQIKQDLKKILKIKGMTYRDLARELALSESAVKKIFTADDCALGRIEEICDILEVHPTDLILERNRRELKTEKFTREQEEYFVKNLEHFHYFWKLVVERKERNQVENEMAMSQTAGLAILLQLDQFGLIELHENEKIKRPKLSLKKWIGEGPLTDLIQESWSQKMVSDRFKFKNEKKSESFHLRYLKLSDEHYRELIKDLEEIEIKYQEYSIRDQNFLPQDSLREMKLLMMASLGGFTDQVQ